MAQNYAALYLTIYSYNFFEMLYQDRAHMTVRINFLRRKNLTLCPFYGWGSTASRLVPLQGRSLLFTTKL